MSKTADPQLDDLEAVRNVVSALEKFPRDDQHRILRWAQENSVLTRTCRPLRQARRHLFPRLQTRPRPHHRQEVRPTSALS